MESKREAKDIVDYVNEESVAESAVNKAGDSEMKRKIVCFIPSASESNRFVGLMRKAITLAGYQLMPGNSLKEVLKSQVIHLNWYEDISVSKNKRLFKYIKKRMVIQLIKTCRKKMVVTLHNKQQHDESNPYSRKLLELLLKKSNAIIIHSHSSIPVLKDMGINVNEKKIFFVPLPNYIDCYPRIREYVLPDNCDTEGKTVFLFVGQIRPYKNVEVIIEAVNRMRHPERGLFLICGRCSSVEYKQELLSMKRNDAIVFDFRFIPDEEIKSLISFADIEILPYNTKSALNSASIILAFSEGKTIISTHCGTTDELEDQELVYLYNDSDDLEHDIDGMVHCIESVLSDIETDRNAIKEKGEKLREIMKQKNSQEVVSQAIRVAYESC